MYGASVAQSLSVEGALVAVTGSDLLCEDALHTAASVSLIDPRLRDSPPASGASASPEGVASVSGPGWRCAAEPSPHVKGHRRAK